MIASALPPEVTAPVRASLFAFGGRLAGSEDDLMAAYADGDRRSFDELFRALSPRLHAFLLRTFGERATADDVLQITWLKIHTARASYRRGDPVRPWAMQIAARAAVDELRKRRRLAEDGDEEAMEQAQGEAAPGPLADEVADRNALAARVHEALGKLRETQRMVVLLHRFEGLTFAEIGRSLGISEGSAKLRAFRAYEVLRAALAPHVEEDAA